MLENHVPEKTWKTRDGRIIPIAELDDSHLVNIIEFIKKKGKVPFSLYWKSLPKTLIASFMKKVESLSGMDSGAESCYWGGEFAKTREEEAFIEEIDSGENVDNWGGKEIVLNSEPSVHLDWLLMEMKSRAGI
jgi:hypothetical protein